MKQNRERVMWGIMKNREMVFKEKAVAFILATYIDTATGECTVELSTLTKACGHTQKWTERILSQLKEKGILSLSGEGGPLNCVFCISADPEPCSCLDDE